MSILNIEQIYKNLEESNAAKKEVNRMPYRWISPQSIIDNIIFELEKIGHGELTSITQTEKADECISKYDSLVNELGAEWTRISSLSATGGNALSALNRHQAQCPGKCCEHLKPNSLQCDSQIISDIKLVMNENHRVVKVAQQKARQLYTNAISQREQAREQAAYIRASVRCHQAGEKRRAGEPQLDPSCN